LTGEGFGKVMIANYAVGACDLRRIAIVQFLWDI
jgi:hypothetical protein